MGQVSANVKDRGGPLEALRFLAAAFIVLYHIGPDAPVPLWDLSPIFARGWLATDFFLMLSGYILGKAYGPSLDAGRISAVEFFKRRLLRVWPAQVVVLLIFVLILAATTAVGIAPRHPQNFTAAEFFQQLGLVHAWGFSHTLGWNQPSWSLSVLVVCYMLFAPVWAATRRLTPLTALVAGPVLVLAAALGTQALLGESLYDMRFDMGLIRGIPLFLCGALLSRASAGVQMPVKSAQAFFASGVGALVVSQLVARTEASAFAAILAIGAVIVAADAWKGSSKIAAAGARISFALFISSAIVDAVWFGVVRMLEARFDVGQAGLWALWALCLPMAVAGAWLFDRFVDAPLQRWIKAFRSRPGRCPAPAPSGSGRRPRSRPRRSRRWRARSPD